MATLTANPQKNEQVVRVFAPDLARLDMYVLDDQKLINEITTGNDLSPAEKPCRAATIFCPCPRVLMSSMFTCDWSPITRCART